VITRPFATFVLLAAACCPAAAFAQTSRGGGGGASPQIMQQYQQLSAERTALVTENARLKQDAEEAKAQLGALRKERDALKARGGGAGRDIEKANADKAAAELALADARRRLEALLAKYKETIGVLETVEGDKARLDREAVTANQALDQCAVHNVALYDVAIEVLGRWEHDGLWSRLGRAEPFTRLKRTELENLVDGYRARADESKLRGKRSAPPPLRQPVTGTETTSP